VNRKAELERVAKSHFLNGMTLRSYTVQHKLNSAKGEQYAKGEGTEALATSGS
jgi:hypothetical protein